VDSKLTLKLIVDLLARRSLETGKMIVNDVKDTCRISVNIVGDKAKRLFELA